MPQAMSICQSGMECNIKPSKISIGIEEHHPLLGLANVIEWEELAEMVLPDLKSTQNEHNIRGITPSF